MPAPDEDYGPRTATQKESNAEGVVNGRGHDFWAQRTLRTSIVGESHHPMCAPSHHPMWTFSQGFVRAATGQDDKWHTVSMFVFKEGCLQTKMW